ncbi:MAG: hypothetical protein NTY38_04940 [Acidobacteria bacterium]|nr:hypothetical protein [Acidobacteriota bacterium]
MFYTLGEKTVKLHGKGAEKPIPGEKFEHDKNIGRAIGMDRRGDPWVSGEGGALYVFGRKQNLTAPAVPGREPYTGVDAWATDPASGTLYGGTSDGYLFRIFGGKVENLGKALSQYRIRGLAFAPNGKLYGIGGDDDDMARLFSYNPKNGVYEMLGMVDVNRRPYYTWHAYVIDALAFGLDGTLYLGQAERKSKLYLYYP